MDFLHEGSDVPLGGRRPELSATTGGSEAGTAPADAAAPVAEDEAAAGTFTVTIPEGVEAGQQLQVGSWSALNVRVAVGPCCIATWRVTQTFSKQVNTPDGRQLLVTVPPGVAAGQQLQITAPPPE